MEQNHCSGSLSSSVLDGRRRHYRKRKRKRKRGEKVKRGQTITIESICERSMNDFIDESGIMEAN